MDKERLIKVAFEALENSYAPYSHFHVGAALLGESGKIYTGCNVESCAFTPSTCAERTALVKAVSEGERHFTGLVVVAKSETGEIENYTSPCGVCRQMLYEFCDQSMPIIMAKNENDFFETTLGALLPMGFGPEKLGGRDN